MHTVKQLAEIAGVTPRTLHHYDRIGLLKPTSIGKNGYRFYGDETLYRLQQILFYRELGFALKDIKTVIEAADFEVLGALKSHRAALQGEVKRLHRLIRTIDNTAERLKGNGNMEPKRLFEGFSDAEQVELEAEAAERWDADIVHSSNKRWKGYSARERQRILDNGNALYAELAAVMPKGASSPEAQELMRRWRKHMEYFWSPTDEQLLGLADLYNEDPQFKANYERFAAGLASFMREAVRVYVADLKKHS